VQPPRSGPARAHPPLGPGVGGRRDKGSGSGPGGGASRSSGNAGRRGLGFRKKMRTPEARGRSSSPGPRMRPPGLGRMTRGSSRWASPKGRGHGVKRTVRFGRLAGRARGRKGLGRAGGSGGNSPVRRGGRRPRVDAARAERGAGCGARGGRRPGRG
jgi:hypothetical protein